MANDTCPGKSRFLFFLSQLQTILENASSSENIVLSIYSANARTPLFMLEGLTRLYKKMHNKKKFGKLEKLFKDFEDGLGTIDYYDAFYREFTNNKKIPDRINTYVNDKKEKSVEALGNELKKRKWIGKHKKRISTITRKLDKIDWLDQQEDTRNIFTVYQDYISQVTKTYGSRNLHFTELESQVHELRRELRWLSIYPQALQGLIQLSEEGEPNAMLEKYLVPEIIASPYNVMPDGSSSQHPILLNKSYFLALSWMIAALGKLKDSGLKLSLIEDSLVSIFGISAHASELAISFCDENQLSISEILYQSQTIAQTFFRENIPEHLICNR